jgi:hypothetical protein
LNFRKPNSGEFWKAFRQGRSSVKCLHERSVCIEKGSPGAKTFTLSLDPARAQDLILARQASLRLIWCGCAPGVELIEEE